MIAAIASAHGLPLYTRNAKDLVGLGDLLEIVEASLMSPCYQPRARHSGSDGRSLPRVVSSPWPG